VWVCGALSNGAPGVVDPNTGAPTGFDETGAIQPAAAIDFNWKNVTPFSLSTLKKAAIGCSSAAFA
jgi:hypothetical protein